MIHFWKPEDYEDLHKAENFSELFPIALRVIERMPQPVAMIAGPISTGGRGSIEANLHLLSAAVDLAYSKGISVFDQNPFESKMQDIKRGCTHEGYCMELLEDFHKPVFESGKLQTVYFLPDWQSSTGSKWEHEQCQRLGIKTQDYPTEWIRELEQQ